MIDQLISELVAYGLQNGLIEDADKVYVTNGLLELFQKQDYQEPNASVEPRDLHFILEDMLAFALSEGYHDYPVKTGKRSTGYCKS